ncbi:cell wall metabolism sensor histidine kinase WalK [Nostoc sp. 2RC]|uniref:sensor histidine kinase n=1 Tax=Nostoc sp. 2RC TaxID=2485484 RepID=UPI001624CF14|nr:HAMP domain-containing sensor histidine kinase [Nostoc sp. 2RC]MBC1239774.1 two-component sensor histidine kinase [Nostoc sp. 2RC]
MFQTLGRRLLLSYLGVMIAIWGTAITVVYHFLAYNLYQKLDNEIINLANAAAHNLIESKVKQKTFITKLPPVLDNDDDGDLDIPWQDLRASNQEVEWFNVDGKLLAKAGNTFAQMPFSANFHVSQSAKVRSIIIPVYLHSLSEKDKKLQGYVRVSESTAELEAELKRVLWGFELGGLIVIILSGLGGWWLTRQSLQPIEQSFQQLKQFTADASHELRNPLTIVKTSVDVMMNYPERIHPANINKLVAISSATNQMTQLVEDLLLLARTDAVTNIQRIDWRAIPLDELLEDLVELLEPQAISQEITLKSEISTEVLVKGEVIQLKRLFSNLLQNALQYTPKGGTVIVSLVKLERLIAINVQDTGIGIAAEQIPLIFHRFWRADLARSQREGGTGLGLAIAQAIAKTHGGGIIVTSEVGVGSCFQVRLPLASEFNSWG